MGRFGVTDRTSIATGRSPDPGTGAFFVRARDVERFREMLVIPCPNCNRDMIHGRTQGPTPEVHPRRGRDRKQLPCRWAITPDPAGIGAWVEAVPKGMTAEQLADRRREEWETEHGIGSYIRARLAGR